MLARMSLLPPSQPREARVFVALWPHDPVRAAIAAYMARWPGLDRTRPVPLEKLHMTLHFLGAVPRADIDGLRAGLSVGVEPFDMRLDTAQVWRGGVAVLTPSSVPFALHALHGRLRSVLSRMKQATARETFLPHVTVARQAWRTLPPPEAPAIPWRVQGYALIESLPGAAYLVLQSYCQDRRRAGG